MSVDLWFYDSVTLWLCGSVTLRLALWFCGSVAMRLSGSMTLSLFGSVALCPSASCVPGKGYDVWKWHEQIMNICGGVGFRFDLRVNTIVRWWLFNAVQTVMVLFTPMKC